MKKFLILGILLWALVLPLAAQAQFGDAVTKLDSVATPTGLNKDINTSISTIIKGALSLVGTIFLILAVYAGILWMTAMGNEEKVTKAKDIITQAIIGLAITLAAYAITAFVTTKLNSGGTSGGSTGGSGTGSCQPGSSSNNSCGAADSSGSKVGGCLASCDVPASGYTQITDVNSDCKNGEQCYQKQ